MVRTDGADLSQSGQTVSLQHERFCAGRCGIVGAVKLRDSRRGFLENGRRFASYILSFCFALLAKFGAGPVTCPNCSGFATGWQGSLVMIAEPIRSKRHSTLRSRHLRINPPTAPGQPCSSKVYRSLEAIPDDAFRDVGRDPAALTRPRTVRHDVGKRQ
jgi:hypothetical protein